MEWLWMKAWFRLIHNRMAVNGDKKCGQFFEELGCKLQQRNVVATGRSAVRTCEFSEIIFQTVFFFFWRLYEKFQMRGEDTHWKTMAFALYLISLPLQDPMEKIVKYIQNKQMQSSVKNVELCNFQGRCFDRFLEDRRQVHWWLNQSRRDHKCTTQALIFTSVAMSKEWPRVAPSRAGNWVSKRMIVYMYSQCF